MKHLNCILCFTILSVLNLSLNAQDKTFEKFNKYFEKGQIDKAEAYYKEISKELKYPEKYCRLLGEYYFAEKNYAKTEEYSNCAKSNTLNINLADLYYDKNSGYYDPKKAAAFYRAGEQYGKAASIWYELENYEQTLQTCKSEKMKIYYGDKLYEEGKIEEALMFYKKTNQWKIQEKEKGKYTYLPSRQENIATYYLKQKDYKKAYEIMDFKEDNFSVEKQGIVIQEMMKNKESNDFIIQFADEIMIDKEMQKELFPFMFLNAKCYDAAFEYCSAFSETEEKDLAIYIWRNNKPYMPDGFWLAGKLFLDTDNKQEGEKYLIRYISSTARRYESFMKNNFDIGIKNFYENTKPLIESCGYTYQGFMLDVLSPRTLKWMKDDNDYSVAPEKGLFHDFDEAERMMKFVQAMLETYY